MRTTFGTILALALAGGSQFTATAAFTAAALDALTGEAPALGETKAE